MKFFYLKNKMYDLLGWVNYIDTTGMYLLNKLCELEQMFHSDYKKKVNWDIHQEGFFISDKDLQEFTMIKSRTTIRKHINKLIDNGLIRTSEDRKYNREGKATQYFIIKPVPLPPEIKTPKIFIMRHGQNFVENLIEEHKELFFSSSGQNLSAQKMDAEPSKNAQRAAKNCTPRIDVEIERKKEREKFESESDSETEVLSENKKEIVRLSRRYMDNAKQILKPLFENIDSQTEELIIQVLKKNEEVGFEAESGYSFILSLFTNQSYLEKMAAAEISKVNQSGGFQNKQYPDYEKEKKNKKKKDSRRAQSHEETRKLIESHPSKSSNISPDLDEEDVPDEELPF